MINPDTIFSQEQLDKVVAEHLPIDAKPGEKIILGSVDRDGAQVIISWKLKSQANGLEWQVMAAAQHTWDGDNKFGTKVLLRWE